MNEHHLFEAYLSGKKTIKIINPIKGSMTSLIIRFYIQNSIIHVVTKAYLVMKWGNLYASTQ